MSVHVGLGVSSTESLMCLLPEPVCDPTESNLLAPEHNLIDLAYQN